MIHDFWKKIDRLDILANSILFKYTPEIFFFGSFRLES